VSPLNAALAFALAALLSYVLTLGQSRLAVRFGFLDVPDARRKHEGLRPRLGGPGLLIAFCTAALLAGYGWNSKFAVLLAAACALVGIGAIDDKRVPRFHELPASVQLLAQLGAAGLAILGGIYIVDVRDPTAPAPFGGVLHLPLWAAVIATLFWIAGMINTVNLLDGMDGLAGGVAAIAAAVLGLVSLRLGQTDVAILCFALAGAACGFLPHNLSRSHTFMGTSGAWFLGFMLAALSIVGGAKLATALLVVGVPVLDVALLILLRSLRHQPFWQGDRSHLFHRLLDVGLSPGATLLLYCSISAVFGLFAFVFTSNSSIGLGLKIYGLVGLVLVMALLLGMLTRRGTTR